MSGNDYTATAGGAERAYSYLLGEMSEAEQVRFERDFLADADAYENYLAAQDELMEAYSRGELSPDRRVRFDRHFLTNDARRERLQLIRDLDEHAASPQAAGANPRPEEAPAPAPASRPAGSFASRLRRAFVGPLLPRFALAPAFALAALSVLVCFVGWRLMFDRSGTRSEQARSTPPPAIQQTHPAGTPADTSAQTPPAAETRPTADPSQVAAANQPPAPPAPIAPGSSDAVKATPAPRRAAAPATSYALILSPLSMRDAGDATRPLRLPQAANATLRLRLMLEDASEVAAVRAQLQTAEGAEVFARDNLRVRRQRSASFVTLNLATTLLADGDYTIKLTGPDADGEAVVVARYSFTVIRR